MADMRRIVPIASLLSALLVWAVATATATAASTPATAAKRLVVTGGGFGHGVGMSQYGAWGMALQGADHAAILRNYYRGTELGRVSPTRTVRVLLAEPRTLAFSGASRAGTRALRPGARYTARLDGDAIVISGGSARRFRLPSQVRISGPGPLQVGVLGGFRGALELRPAAARPGSLQVVNAVGLDDYVRGVIAAEMPASWAIEALKAQAVVARTYAIATNKNGPGYDHFADARSQVYGGVIAETARTDIAVAETRGRVVTYDGQPVETYFMSSSGGRTESVENAFGGPPKPWLVSVADPYDRAPGNSYYRWTRTFTLAEAERKLGDLVQGSLRRIRILERGDSPRVLRAEIVGSEGTTSTSGAMLRARLALPDAPSRLSVR